MWRPKIERDLIDRVLIYKIKSSKIPHNRIEKDCKIPLSTLSYSIKAKHIPMKYRSVLDKYFKNIAEKLWNTSKKQ